jgi:hypothetical protein
MGLKLCEKCKSLYELFHTCYNENMEKIEHGKKESIDSIPKKTN